MHSGMWGHRDWENPVCTRDRPLWAHETESLFRCRLPTPWDMSLPSSGHSGRGLEKPGAQQQARPKGRSHGLTV